MEHGGLARQLLGVVRLREGHIEVLLLADVHADHLLLKARDEGVGADFEGLALGGAARKGDAVHSTRVVEVHGVALGDGAVLHGDLGRLLLALLLNLGIDLRVGDLGHGLLDGHALVLAQGHVRLDKDLAGELQVLARADLLDLDLRTIDDLQLVLLHGRAVDLVKDELERIVIEDALAVHVLDQLARGLALAEARDVHLTANLDVCLVHRLVELRALDVKGQLHLIAGNLFHGSAHALLFLLVLVASRKPQNAILYYSTQLFKLQSFPARYSRVFSRFVRFF